MLWLKTLALIEGKCLYSIDNSEDCFKYGSVWAKISLAGMFQNILSQFFSIRIGE
jgi:hypothetical protein